MSCVGKVNVYTCPVCRGETVTIDVDEGVTPFMIACRATARCNGWAKSSMYRPRTGHAPPAWEWYKPSASEAAKLSPGMRAHVEMGGLDLRRKV